MPQLHSMLHSFFILHSTCLQIKSSSTPEIVLLAIAIAVASAFPVADPTEPDTWIEKSSSASSTSSSSIEYLSKQNTAPKLRTLINDNGDLDGDLKNKFLNFITESVAGAAGATDGSGGKAAQAANNAAASVASGPAPAHAVQEEAATGPKQAQQQLDTSTTIPPVGKSTQREVQLQDEIWDLFSVGLPDAHRDDDSMLEATKAMDAAEVRDGFRRGYKCDGLSTFNQECKE